MGKWFTPNTPNKNSRIYPDNFEGVLKSKYKVYVDPAAKEGELLVGYKGTSPYDAGYFYSPYIPLQIMDSVNEGEYKPKIAFKNRYGDVKREKEVTPDFSIDKIEVTAKSRALKAEWAVETAQDLKAIHGIDAEAELTNILSAEILAEINREIVKTLMDIHDDPEGYNRSESVWHFDEETQTIQEEHVNIDVRDTGYMPAPDVELETKPLSFNNSEWFKALGENYEYGPMAGRREETPDTDGVRVTLDVGEDG